MPLLFQISHSSIRFSSLYRPLGDLVSEFLIKTFARTSRLTILSTYLIHPFVFDLFLKYLESNKNYVPSLCK